MQVPDAIPGRSTLAQPAPAVTLHARPHPHAPGLPSAPLPVATQDLPPPGDDDAWVYDLPHKDVKQLMRMALAQAEAEVAPPPPVPEKKGGAGAGAAGAGAGAGGAKAGGKGKGEEPPPERPYVPGQWELPAGGRPGGSGLWRAWCLRGGWKWVARGVIDPSSAWLHTMERASSLACSTACGLQPLKCE